MGYRKSMQRRWIAGLVLVSAASAGLYLATRGGDKASSAPETTAANETPERNAPVQRKAPPERVQPHRKRIPLDRGKAEVSPEIKKWKEEGLPGYFREAVPPDESKVAEQQLQYKMRRLRFELSDTAATCYTGDGSKESVIVGYDLVVSDGVLSLENVRKLSSTLTDPALESCILDKLTKLRAPADDIPDARSSAKATLDLESLAAANRRAMRESE